MAGVLKPWLLLVTFSLSIIVLTPLSSPLEQIISRPEEANVVAVGDQAGNRGGVEHEHDSGVVYDNLTSFGLRRFLAAKPATCDRYPKLCRLPGSPGRDCCKKVCTNAKTDRLNCGKCGKKCKFTEACCQSKCVNLAFDRSNCGVCGRKCKKHTYCLYGVCGYV